MSDTVTIRNKTNGAREIDDVGVCEPGDTIDVPDELANGTPPSGKPDDLDYHPGTSGLLAQTDVWEKATTKRTRSDDTPSGEEV